MRAVGRSVGLRAGAPAGSGAAGRRARRGPRVARAVETTRQQLGGSAGDNTGGGGAAAAPAAATTTGVVVPRARAAAAEAGQAAAAPASNAAAAAAAGEGEAGALVLATASASTSASAPAASSATTSSAGSRLWELVWGRDPTPEDEEGGGAGSYEPPPPVDPDHTDGIGAYRPIFELALAFTLIPIGVSTTLRVGLVEPFLVPKDLDAPVYALSELQRDEIADKMAAAERRQQYEVLMGRNAPDTRDPKRAREELAKEVHEMEEEVLEENRKAYVNVLVDSLTAGTIVTGLVTNKPKLLKERKRFRRRFFKLESSSQAFVLLLIADMLVGYHSSEGWMTVLKLSAEHYGIHEGTEDVFTLFVATVPVSLDVLFKYWVFRFLRKLSPSTQIILETIDRG